MTDSNTHIVKSAQRVLQVIEFFNEDRPAASVSEISRALSYPQSSTSVLLRCLRQLGYLYYNRFNRTYRLTARAALLGCFAEQGNYRGGRALDMLDAVAARTSETVVLSVANVDYALHHLHVMRGSSASAVEVLAGSAAPMLGNVQGELQLASYPEANVRLALHRLNAEEPDPERRVAIAEKLAEFRLARDRGWSIGPHAGGEGASAVAAMVPRHKGGDRVVVSIVAADGLIEQKGSEFLKIILDERDRAFAPASADAPRKSASSFDLRALMSGGAGQRFAVARDAY
jgi:DNA-binding IclR family transcriptional regulator